MKLSSLGYLLKEGAKNIWSNRTMSFASVGVLVSCLLLTGADSKERRREMVAQFQSGGADVFFISLKAGGTGLNLTAADRIIHFDPWWNAAAEEQATDRAHRIGQDRTVFVTKLVAKGTVEERIAALQAQKRALSDTVMESGTLDGTIGKEALLALLGAR